MIVLGILRLAAAGATVAASVVVAAVLCVRSGHVHRKAFKISTENVTLVIILLRLNLTFDRRNSTHNTHTHCRPSAATNQRRQPIESKNIYSTDENR